MTTTPMHPAPARATLTRAGDRELRVERTFNAPLEKVWRAMSDPALVAQWWGRGNHLVIERDERVRGGHWRYVEHADGQAHGFEGRYAEVVPMQRVSRTFEWDGMPGHVLLETATFEDLGDGRTRLVSTTLFMTVEDLEGMMASGMEGGMNQSYEALDRVLAAP